MGHRHSKKEGKLEGTMTNNKRNNHGGVALGDIFETIYQKPKAKLVGQDQLRNNTNIPIYYIHITKKNRAGPYLIKIGPNPRALQMLKTY